MKTIRLFNKGAFFNTKMLLSNEKVLETGIFKRNYSIAKVEGDKSRLSAKFILYGEEMVRSLELTFLNF